MAVQLSAFPIEYERNPLKQIVTTGEKFEAMIRWLKSRKRIVVDYETSGIAWFQHATYCGIGLAGWDEQGRIWNAYVPVRHRTGATQLSAELIAPAIKDLLGDPAIEKVGHNIKFEDHFSRKEGWRIRGPRYDTMVAARLYDDNAPLKLEKRAELDLGIKDSMTWNLTLNAEVAKLARANGMKIEEYKWRFGYSEVDPVLCGIYCCTDTDHTAKLRDHYETWGVSRHYPRIWATEMRLTEVLCDMEEAGMPIDVPYLQAVREQAQEAKAGLEVRINQLMGGYQFNVGSDDELRATLYHVLGLRWEKRTKGNQLAVDREVLEGFAGTTEVCGLILAWRDADKIVSTYTTSLIELLDGNNIIHGNLKSMGTNTGRLSCTEPNYQNISTDDEDRSLVATGKKVKDGGVDPWSIRRAFPVRGPGWARVYLDYSQIELRVMAYYSRDPILVETYLTGGDVHERTAREIGAKLGIEAIPRRVAKVINFGLCLSGHQKVLTNKGVVRLDEITTSHKLWDGVAWVAHDGLICRGEQDVIEFGGIEATPDHAVFTEDGGKVQLGDLASEAYPRRLAVGAIGVAPQFYNSCVDREGGDAWALTGGRNSVQRLQEGSLDLCRCDSRETCELSLPEGQVQRSSGPFVGSALRRYGAALRAGYACFFGELQGAWDQGALSVAGAFHSVGFGGVPGNGLQGLGLRSDQQRGALRARQHAARVAFLQSLESSETWWRVLQEWASALGGQPLLASSGAACLPGLYAPVRPSVPRPQTHRTVVYDLLNAGPRHRFTVEGVIVSNSYCMSEKGVAANTKIPVEEAALFLQAFFQRYGGISSFRQELWAKARREGCQWSNIFGRTRRLPNLVADEFWMRKRAERQMIGSAIQGTAAELTKESLVRIADWLAAEKIPALLVNTVHDEIQLDTPRECLSQVVKGCKRLMEAFPEFHPIPIIAEPAVSFTNWAEKVAYQEESANGQPI